MNLRIAVERLMDTLQRVVFTAIVDKEDVKVGIVFFQERLNGPRGVHFLVVGRHDDRDLGCVVFRQGRIMALAILAFLHDHEVIHEGKTHEAKHDEDNEQWTLNGVQGSKVAQEGDVTKLSRISEASMNWPTKVTAAMVSGALLKPDRMTTIALFQFVRHLQDNGQAAQKYEIEFWRKVFYPLSCLVMVVLALPFAYLHFRSGGITAYVFGGVMAGISFFLLNNVFGYIGTLQSWWPWLAAAAPGLLYTALSLSAFAWLVLRR